MEFIGHIVRIIFPKAGALKKNDYHILLVRSNGNEFCVKGSLKTAVIGDELLFVGEEDGMNKYGQTEFKLDYVCFPDLDTTEGLQKYLQKIAGEKTGKLIFQHLGHLSMHVLEQEPDRLLLIPGIREKTKEKILTAHHEMAQMINPRIFAQLRNFMPEYMIRLGLERWKSALEKVVHKNPYRLTELKGVGFAGADKVGMKLGVAYNSPYRIGACLHYMQAKNEEFGHAYIIFSDLCEQTADELSVTGKDRVDPIEVAAVLEELCQERKFIREGNRIYDVETHADENGLARRLVHYALESTPLQVNMKQVMPTILEEFRNFYKNPTFEFGSQQQQFLSMLDHNALLLQGDPGTGKTTTILAAVRLLQYGFSKEILAIAPTGCAAQRMTDLLGFEAMTIHSALGYNSNDGGYEYHSKNPLEYKVYLIDETTMLDTSLGCALLKSIPKEAKIIFIGDVNQIQSVGAGKVFYDMVNSGVIPSVYLTEPYRNALDSGINKNALLINNGQFPNAESKWDDFIYHPVLNEEEALEKIIESAINVAEVDNDWIVLLPNKGSSCGANHVNRILQEMLNPLRENELQITVKKHLKKKSKEDYEAGEFDEGVTYQIRPRDRVIHCKNDKRNLKVANGETGIVESVIFKEKVIDGKSTGVKCLHASVTYKGGKGTRTVIYNEDQVKEYLELSYAISIHKSQGSEWNHVIVGIGPLIYTLMKRNILFTAVTRAKKACDLIGTRKAITKMVTTPDTSVRLTTLKERIIAYSKKKLAAA